jgi:DNA-binding CsgD family transcriptional regulator
VRIREFTYILVAAKLGAGCPKTEDMLMERLSGIDLQKIRTFLENTSVPGDLATFPSRILPALWQLVPSDFVCRSELHPALKKTFGRESNPNVDTEIDNELFDQHVWEHPIVQYWAGLGDTPAASTSNLTSMRLWHDSGLYQNVYRKLGTTDSLGIGLPAPPGLVAGIYIERGGICFSERETLLLETVRPHIAQLYRQAEMFSLLEHAAAEGANAMILDISGRPLLAPQATRDLVARYFPGPAESGSIFPQPLSGWLSRQLRRFSLDFEVPAPPSDLVEKRQEGSSLTLNLILGPRTGEQAMLLLREDRPRAFRGFSPELRLSRREKEVLLLVRRGLSNPQIADVLFLSRRTVEKHLENIYCKLGVENRNAAVARCFPE